jgi:serine/threonine-protein kinase
MVTGVPVATAPPQTALPPTFEAPAGTPQRTTPQHATTPSPISTPLPAATPQTTVMPPASRSLAASMPPGPSPVSFDDGEAPTALAPTSLGEARATVHTHTHDTDAPTELSPGGTALPTPAPQAPGPSASMITAVPGSQMLPGMRLGRYQVERHLGRGGMGDVYLVRDTIINRPAALKTIRPDSDLDAKQVIEMRQRFIREAQTAGKLSSPYIVTVFDVGEELGMAYIVMEFVEGLTLTHWMKKQRFNVPQIKHVIYHAGLGLAYAHEHGVFHRDVKPDNIMLSNTGAVKVMDFGIARSVESNLTKTGSVMGTPAYMSPEQVHGERIDGRSDTFSLGVILYELLTGQKPFRGDTMPSLMMEIMRKDPRPASSVDPSVHPAWDDILKKVLAKNRAERYAAVKDFALAVRDCNAR